MKIFIILTVLFFISVCFAEAQMTFDGIQSPSSAKFRSASPKNGNLVMTRKQDVQNHRSVDVTECRTAADCTFGFECTNGECWCFL